MFNAQWVLFGVNYAKIWEIYIKIQINAKKQKNIVDILKFYVIINR